VEVVKCTCDLCHLAWLIGRRRPARRRLRDFACTWFRIIPRFFVAACDVRSTEDWLGEQWAARHPRTRLFFVQILFRHIVLRDLVGVDFPFLIFICVFDTRYDVSLERISFLDQLVDAFRISAFNVA
jgi:hypothetical protein